VTNKAFSVFAEAARSAGIALPAYPVTEDLGKPTGSRNPVSFLTWHEARAYCRFLGKDLPTSRQWVKALRGGLTLPDGTPNPAPRRNLPWIEWREPIPARVKVTVKQAARGTAPVGTHPADTSPYGVQDLAGNVEEWTSTGLQPRVHAVRGGNWAQTDETTLLDVMAVDNIRPDGTVTFSLGVRCASGGGFPPREPGD
jgi:formylglycine-generating enzyme required for sulfatase activity